MPAFISLSIGSAVSQHILVNIKIQASKEGGIKSDFTLEGIQFQSGAGIGERVYDRSFGSIRSVTVIAS